MSLGLQLVLEYSMSPRDDIHFVLCLPRGTAKNFEYFRFVFGDKKEVGGGGDFVKSTDKAYSPEITHGFDHTFSAVWGRKGDNTWDEDNTDRDTIRYYDIPGIHIASCQGFHPPERQQHILSSRSNETRIMRERGNLKPPQKS